MISKAELIRKELLGLNVLDLGGTGYEEENPYEQELWKSWQSCASRTIVDDTPSADVRVDLNTLPLPAIQWSIKPDIVTAFDVLEHLEHPADVLRWIPSNKLIVTLPNALSPITRRMEYMNRPQHLFSFTPYTASVLMNAGGWQVDRIRFQFGKWSAPMKLANFLGSACPPYIGTGIILYCTRGTCSRLWKLR